MNVTAGTIGIHIDEETARYDEILQRELEISRSALYRQALRAYYEKLLHDRLTAVSQRVMNALISDGAKFDVKTLEDWFRYLTNTLSKLSLAELERSADPNQKPDTVFLPMARRWFKVWTTTRHSGA